MKDQKALINFTMRLLAMLGVLMSLYGCVGSVEKGDPQETQFYEKTGPPFFYKGITRANGISHDKIELEFSVLPSEEYTYFLQIDGGNAVKMNLEDLGEVIQGQLRYVIENLSIDQTYMLKVTAKHNITGATSYGEKEFVAKTYKEFIPDFKGIQSIELVPGSGDRRVRINWFNPIFQGGVVAHPNDAAFYELAIIKESDGIERLKTYDNDEKIFYRRIPNSENNSFTYLSANNPPITSFIDGLDPDTVYYFRMRVVHQNWESIYKSRGGSQYLPLNNELMIDTMRDANTRILKIRTLKSLSATTVDPNSLSLNAVDGVDAYTKINANWPAPGGSFLKYRLMYKQYLYTGAPTDTHEQKLYQASIDDQMPVAILKEIYFPEAAPARACDGNITYNGQLYGCKEVDPGSNSFIITNLTAREFFQVKLLVCRDEACTIEPTDLNAAVMTSFQTIFTQAILAPFSGISIIENPSDVNFADRVKLNYDPPSLTKGWATDMKLYCIDPEKVANSNYTFADVVEVGSLTETSGTGITQCDGLIRDSFLTTTSKQTYVSGLRNVYSGIDQSRYCFAMVPQITPSVSNGQHSLQLDISSWVIRCVNPELDLPDLNEFIGFDGVCSVSDDNIELNWSLPSAGLYNGFKIFVKEVGTGEKLDFQELLTSATNVSPSCISNTCIYNANLQQILGIKTNTVAIDNNTFILSNPMPGKTYAIGILALAETSDGTFYSEFNTGVKYCNALMPKANFVEWTRVFAIGPKIDGRYRKSSDGSFSSSAHLHEAINSDGIPYELKRSPGGSTTSDIIMNPPGNYDYDPLISDPISSFTTVIDGRPNELGNYFSNEGIISLAFKAVILPYVGANTKFYAEQIDKSVARDQRKYGYRIYRSHDNRQSWINVTDSSKLIYHGDYRYRTNLSNLTEENEKMVFFTDYSVKYQKSFDQYSYARTYWYKIVPVFDGIELMYFDSEEQKPHNEIKVTLPPENMALVHRLMANRKACLSLGKDIRDAQGKPNLNYTCSYNGIGSRARPGTTWQAWNDDNQNLIYDQGGDLLVDRYELSCNFTRGDYASLTPSAGKSYFDPLGDDNANYSDYNFETKHFKQSHGTSFEGCTHSSLITSTSDFGGARTNVNEKFFTWGDCLSTGLGAVTLTSQSCFDVTGTSSSTYIYPFRSTDTNDCTLKNQSLVSEEPSFFYDANYKEASLRTPSRMRKITAQGEFLSVLLLKGQSGNGSYYVSPFGPNDSAILGQPTQYMSQTSGNTSSNCLINLASIGNDAGDLGPIDPSLPGTDYWRSRWVPLGQLDKVVTNNSKKIIDMTLDEVMSDNNLYDSTNYKAPPLPSKYTGGEKLGRVLSSNSAFLPPLSGVSSKLGNELCGQYQVKVGYANDDGSFYSPNPVLRKRLPYQIEKVTIAAWPEDAEDQSQDDEKDFYYNYNGVDRLEGAGSGTIFGTPVGSTIEITAAKGGSCHSGRGVSAVNLQVGDSLDTNYAASASYGAYISGSSIASDSTTNSSRCISMYGIQDVVGNMMPAPIEELVCDYSDREITFAKGSFNKNYTGNGTPVIWAGVTVEDSLGNTIVSGAEAASMSATIDDDIGYCSVTHKDRNFIDDRYPFSDTFVSLFLPDGSIYTPLISRPTGSTFYDYFSLNWLRNGDGHFYNLGDTYIGPSIRRNGDLNLTIMNGQATMTKFAINPVIGLPVNFQNSDYYDTSYLPVNFSFDNDTGYRFMGAGNFSNVGLSEWCRSQINGCIATKYSYTPGYDINADGPVTLAINQLTLDNWGLNPGLTFSAITKFIIQPDGSSTPVYENIANIITTPGNFNYFQGTFALASNTRISMESMGSYARRGGRISMDFMSKVESKNDFGARCLVKINED